MLKTIVCVTVIEVIDKIGWVQFENCKYEKEREPIKQKSDKRRAWEKNQKNSDRNFKTSNFLEVRQRKLLNYKPFSKKFKTLDLFGHRMVSPKKGYIFHSQ